MYIYETIEIEIKNKNTGKTTTQTRRQIAGVRCDYSGRLIDKYNKAYCSYRCNYGSQDSCFGASGEEFKFGKKYGIDVHDFMSQDYCFYDDTTMGTGEYGNAETKMLQEITTMQIRDGRMVDFLTLESIFRFFRIRAATKLIEQGIIHPDDLKAESYE